MVALYNPSTQEVEAGESLELEAGLVYRVSSRSQNYSEKPCLGKYINK